MTARARAFWRWVVEHEAALRAVIAEPTGEEPVLETLLEQLHQVDPNLYYLLGGDETGHELIITAEGELHSFPAVRALVQAAPTLTGWQFIAFKPPMGCDFVLRHEAASIDASQSWFLPAPSPVGFGLKLACPSFAGQHADDYEFAALELLDAVLGELVAARDVKHIEMVKLPASPAQAGFRKLEELPEFLAARGAPRRS